MTTDKKTKPKKQNPSKPAPAAAASSKKGNAAAKSVKGPKNVKIVKASKTPVTPVKTAVTKKAVPTAKKPVKPIEPKKATVPESALSPAVEPVITEPTAVPATASPKKQTVTTAKKPVKTSGPKKGSAPESAATAAAEPVIIEPVLTEPITPPVTETVPADVVNVTPPAVTEILSEETSPVVSEQDPVVAETAPEPSAPVKKGKKIASVQPPAPAPEQEKPVTELKPAAEAKPVKHLVCLLGDDVLVKEYSTLFQEKGIAVLELKSLNSLKNSAKKITAVFELTLLPGEQKSRNLAALDEALPENVPVASCSVASTLLVQTHALKHRHRFVGIGAFPTLTVNPLIELAPSLHTTKAAADGIADLLGLAKKETAMVQDSVGMVMPRILCQIVNEALFTVQNDVATPNDIDEAMKHGTNYPHGPIAWGESIGFGTVVNVLDALYENHHEERYRVAPLLRQMAVAGVFWERETLKS